MKYLCNLAAKVVAFAVVLVSWTISNLWYVLWHLSLPKAKELDFAAWWDDLSDWPQLVALASIVGIAGTFATMVAFHAATWMWCLFAFFWLSLFGSAPKIEGGPGTGPM